VWARLKTCNQLSDTFKLVCGPAVGKTPGKNKHVKRYRRLTRVLLLPARGRMPARGGAQGPCAIPLRGRGGQASVVSPQERLFPPSLPSLWRRGRGEARRKQNAMHIYDIFQETELKAHLSIPQEGPPIWDYASEEWGSQWMDDAIREGIVATITQASGEEAWYYGELSIRPHRTAMESEGPAGRVP